MKKRNLPALILMGELLLITVLHVVKHNQQAIHKERLVITEQNEPPALQLNQKVVYKLNH